jgi:hypothetical protein
MYLYFGRATRLAAARHFVGCVLCVDSGVKRLAARNSSAVVRLGATPPARQPPKTAYMTHTADHTNLG